MAAESLSSINSALSQIFAPDLSRQWNRSAITAALVPAKAGGGKNAAWDVEFSGATATTVAEGSDVAGGEYNSDVNQPAILSWAHYRSSFQISETELDAAASSVGIPQALQDLFGDRVFGAGAKIARAINVDMISATGVDGSSNPTIVGLLGGALDATGTYAGLARGTFTEWAGNVLSNGGVARPLTLDLLAQMDANIFTASREPWTHLLVSAGVLRKYEGLFEPNRRLMGGGNAAGLPSYGSGAQFDASMQVDAWYKGRPVMRDPSIPAGYCIFHNANQVQAKFLPRVLTPQDAVIAQMLGLKGSSGSVTDVTSIPARIAVLAKTGDSIKVSLKTTLQMLVRRPNSMGYIKDISEV
jgi:hypothetical protein